MKKNLQTLILLAVISLSATAQTQLWGTSYTGGATSQGTIFSANGNGTNFHTVYNFVNATGAMPVGQMCVANNGSLYGCTELGGYGDSCVSFRFDPITGTYTNIHDLYANTLLGWEAWSGMMNASDGKLYGTCAAGGANGGGVIFKIDPTNDQYYDIYNFDNVNGGNPYSPLKQFSDGKLYGTTYYGGANGLGVIFSFDPTTSAYTKLYVFDGASGANPKFGGVMEGIDGKLYGMTSAGGVNGIGVIYSFDLGTGSFTTMHSFSTATGQSPQGGLAQAANGMIYGMTQSGGSNSLGVLFSIDPATNAYTDLLDFNGAINGSSPTRSLTAAGNMLYGTTNSGGTSSSGTAFSFDATTNTYTKLADFSPSTTGSSPNCELIITPEFLTTGVSSISSLGISIYPNPATDVLTVSNSENQEVINFTDILGRELATVKTSALSKTTVDITSFPNVFFAKTKNGSTEKFVREK